MEKMIPSVFGKILNGKYTLTGGFQIMKVYLDKKEYPSYDEAEDLREHLNLDDQGSVCDCFCKIRATNLGEINILFEDKNSNSGHSKDMFKAIKQLNTTHKDLKTKKNENIDFAIICRVPVETSFRARSKDNFPAKALFPVTNPKEHMTLDSKNIKGFGVPLLSHL
ncbi:MAG: hypothetical protein AABX17_03905 [Nanoarchaeota archaeon]